MHSPVALLEPFSLPGSALSPSLPVASLPAVAALPFSASAFLPSLHCLYTSEEPTFSPAWSPSAWAELPWFSLAGAVSASAANAGAATADGCCDCSGGDALHGNLL